MVRIRKDWQAPFTIVVRHAPFQERNNWGWDQYDFWNPLKALAFAKEQTSQENNSHASFYMRWNPCAKNRTLCRVVKDYNGKAGVHVIKEFHDPNYPEQKC